MVAAEGLENPISNFPANATLMDKKIIECGSTEETQRGALFEKCSRITCFPQSSDSGSACTYTAFSFSQTAGPNNTVLLNGTWQFALAPTDASVNQLANFYLPNYDATQFVPITIPSELGP